MKIKFRKKEERFVSIKQIPIGCAFSHMDILDYVRIRTEKGYVTLHDGRHCECLHSGAKEYVIRDATLIVEPL